jgi:WD40 repeat protein
VIGPSSTTWDVSTRQQLGETMLVGPADPDYGGGVRIAHSADGPITAEADTPFQGPVGVRWRSGTSGWTSASGVPPDGFSSLALSADGQILVLAVYGLWIWDTVANEQMAARWDDPKATTRRYASLAFAPGSQDFAAAGSDGTVSFWDPWAHAELGPPLRASAHGAITSVAYSPDGRLLATAGDDWTIRLWDSRTYAEIVAPLRDDGPVSGIAFSPDGRRLVSAGLAGVRLWDVATGTRLADLPT